MDNYSKLIIGYLTSRHLHALPVVVGLLVDLPTSPGEFVVHTHGTPLDYDREEHDSIIIDHSHSL